MNLDDKALYAAVLDHVARELDSHIAAPFSIEPAGEHLALLEVVNGRARLISSTSLQEGLERLPDSCGTLERQLSEFQDDVAMALRARWPLQTGAGGAPECTLQSGVLRIRFHAADAELRLADLDLGGLGERPAG
ncbi:hypothetical protein [Nocardia suismassiliense]|uniref:hypothetical protein n=1 Tax=Nocardia suismassiliense TaxID=2077092 RepID=UPI000D1F4EA3|nr:hypothetical protein [Nocardia suismassiliense]